MKNFQLENLSGFSALMMIELLITSGLVVLIWLVQILHYPSFHYVRASDFKLFAHFHAARISFIVVPLMVSEILLDLFMLLSFFSVYRLAIFLLVAGVWLSTFFIQVPCHEKLGNGYDQVVVQKLIDTNWIRTILWSFKFLILLFLVFK